MIKVGRARKELTRAEIIAPGSRGPASIIGWFACVIFVGISLPISWYCRGERSAWCKINFPGSYENLMGYNYLLGPDPVMQENEPFVGHVAFLSGLEGHKEGPHGKRRFEWRPAKLNRTFRSQPVAPSPKDPYTLRVYYGFFATLLTPIVGIMRAMRAVNWLAWALCGWVVWRMTKTLFEDELAALFAVVFVAGGMGMIYHVADYSAHLVSFASYYFGVYLLFKSGILYTRKPLRTHLVLGAYMAVACLTYGNGMVLVAIYVLSAWRHNAFGSIAGASLLALTARPFWKTALGLFGAEAADIEAGQLIDTLHRWRNVFQQPLHHTGQDMLDWLTGCALFDSPVVVVLGLFSAFFLRQWSGLRWFGAAVVGIAIAVPWVVGNTKSGYHVYGVSIWLYCWLGRLLAIGLRRGPAMRLAVLGGVCVIFGSHFAWSTAYLWDGLGPLKTYIAGWECGRPHFEHPEPQVISMTGAEETPVLFGGKATLAEAGAWIREREYALQPGTISFGAAFARRLVPCVYFGLFAAARARSVRMRWILGGATVALTLLSAGLSRATLRMLPQFNYFDQLVLLPGEKMTYRVGLSPAFLERLGKEIEPGDSLGFFRMESVVADSGLELAEPDIAVRAGSVAIPVDDKAVAWRTKVFLASACEPLAAVQALAETGEFTIQMANRKEHPVMIHGWQRRGLSGRELEVTGQENSVVDKCPVLPAVEVRVIRWDGTLKVIGF